MQGDTTDRMFACESEVARLAVDAENRAAALRIHAIYRTFRAAVDHVAATDDVAFESDLPVRDHAAVDPWELARSELAVALAMHVNRAGAMVDLSIELVERAPAILDEVASGRIDERTAGTMVSCLRGVTDDELCRDAAALAAKRYVESLDSGNRPGLGQLRRMMDRAVRSVDPDGVRRRQSEAHRSRGVWIRSAPDGMASVSATLSSAGAEVLAERLDQMAGTGTWSRPGSAAGQHDDEAGSSADDRTPDERRADALVDLATAGPGPVGPTDTGADPAARPDPAAPTGPDDPTGPADPAAPTDPAGPASRPDAAADPAASEAPIRPHVTVILSGDGRSEVFFRRSGESSMAALSDLLARARGATFETVFTGRANSDPRAELKYAIPGWLARRIKLRDGTCRHPGCSVAADRCDVDHVVPFIKEDPETGGLTVEWNLMCLCRTHHRLKTFSGWRYRLGPDGVLDITTETGRSVRTWPSGPLARARQVEDIVDAVSEAGQWPDHVGPGAAPASRPPAGNPFAVPAGTPSAAPSATPGCSGDGAVHDNGRCDCGAIRLDSAPGEVARVPVHSDGSPRGVFASYQFTTRERRRRARLQSERKLLVLERRARREARRATVRAADTDPPPF